MSINEPVAWMTKNGVLFKELPPFPMMDLIPLYTHQNEEVKHELDAN